jgi:HEAT repeat protein
MVDFLEMLSGGDLRSDGRSNEVVEIVLRSPQLLGKLIEALSETDDVIRGRAADALEKVSRTRPELVKEHLPLLIKLAYDDKVPMVKFHIAMIFGNLKTSGEMFDQITSALFHLLQDESVFVKSWVIVSLCIISRRNKKIQEKTIEEIRHFQNHKSIAIRSKVAKALKILENNEPIPPNWLKAKESQVH